ncbi:unnamed protein product (plasmid) [Mycetohabitans rhizoxinica HKI 454]|uniref:Uncharacterized protein n=1 Tax=Mycetohabitans rhizoxinica (strain DSM 19002 / CIP 109453 / HKI 454) TaxID=882378 RepID=E5AU82_MYCRK|nr:unnamed protein product [Mycetohabitans rhizoxinica HKI 454]
MNNLHQKNIGILAFSIIHHINYAYYSTLYFRIKLYAP